MSSSQLSTCSALPNTNENHFFFLCCDRSRSRLGPDGERSGKKVCKIYETLWLHKRDTSWKNQNNEKKHANLPSQICVSPAEKTAKQHKTRPEPTEQKAQNVWRLPLRQGQADRVSEICTNELQSVPTELIGYLVVFATARLSCLWHGVL